jgi:hypothetical protein
MPTNKAISVAILVCAWLQVLARPAKDTKGAFDLLTREG